VRAEKRRVVKGQAARNRKIVDGRKTKEQRDATSGRRGEGKGVDIWERRLPAWRMLEMGKVRWSKRAVAWRTKTMEVLT